MSMPLEGEVPDPQPGATSDRPQEPEPETVEPTGPISVSELRELAHRAFTAQAVESTQPIDLPPPNLAGEEDELGSMREAERPNPSEDRVPGKEVIGQEAASSTPPPPAYDPDPRVKEALSLIERAYELLAEIAQGVEPTTSKILKVLEGQASLSGREVSVRTNLPRNVVTNTLYALVNEGRVRRISNGVYALAVARSTPAREEVASPPPPTPPEPRMVQKLAAAAQTDALMAEIQRNREYAEGEAKRFPEVMTEQGVKRLPYILQPFLPPDDTSREEKLRRGEIIKPVILPPLPVVDESYEFVSLDDDGSDDGDEGA